MQYAYSNDLVGAQNGWEIKANTKPYIALISKNPDAINEPMYCKYKSSIIVVFWGRVVVKYLGVESLGISLLLKLKCS
jgi:hypothetical protein